jgi:hypothetical protein
MSDQPMRLATLDDAGLESVLRASAASIAWPTASAPGRPDIATRVRVRLVAAPPPPTRGAWTGWRPVRRSLALALLALLVLAAIAAAVGLGLPGLRITLGEPPVSPPPSPSSVEASVTPSPGSLGSGLRLGDLVALEDVERLTGVPVRLPTDPAIGPPDAVYVDETRGNQVAFVWAASDALPATREPGIGLILMRFDGRLDDGYRQKLIGADVSVEPVTVGGHRGYWVSGAAHFFFYIGKDGGLIDDGRRWVGDALAWTDDATTYRIESALGRDATKALAESLQ